MSRAFAAAEPNHRVARRSQRFSMLTACLLLPFSVAACSEVDTTDVEDSAEDVEPLPSDGHDEPAADMLNTAFHIEMRDGVRIAVDLWLPRDVPSGPRLATILRATRYWRDTTVLDRAEEPETENEAMAKSFVRAGYAYVAVDARGSGASFGTRAQPWSPGEVADYAEIVDWIVRQPWSDGRIGAFGISYDSNTAEMVGTLGNPAVKAVVPRFGYPDVYADVMFPGGIFNAAFVHTWLERGRAMDANDLCTLIGMPAGPECDAVQASGAGMKRVDTDFDRSLQAAALAQHAQGPDQYAEVSALSFVDDLWDGFDFDALSPGLRGARAEATQTPFMAWASWLDLGTAQGALNRWATTQVPMTVYIGPWNHDASTDANPYLPKDAPLQMSGAEQRALEIAFFDQHLKQPNGATPERKIVYFTLGEDVWKQTHVWPPAGTEMTPLYLAATQSLSQSAPTRADADRYLVDFTASTGDENGWWTKFTGADIYRADRRAEDEKLLVYTSAPLELDTEITGHPQVTLYLSSTETDGAVFVYLEDVAPDGSVTYLTEGQLRLIHRKPCAEPAAFNAYGPCHSYKSEDALPFPRDVVQEVSVGLHPVSVLLRAGHSFRVAIAGHDASSFARIPAEGAPVLSVSHGPQHLSRIELPMVPRK